MISYEVGDFRLRNDFVTECSSVFAVFLGVL
jgi:hypothetical protein